MSKGVGRTQRLALLSLWQVRVGLEEEERDIGIQLTELKRRISSDRSNARRALRSLMARGMVKEITGEAEGERRVKLTSGGHGALTLASVFCDPGEDFTEADVPSRPFDFASIYRGTEWDPHGASETSWTYGDDLETPVSDNGTPHANGDMPRKGEAMPETPVNDNAISRALAWLEDGL